MSSEYASPARTETSLFISSMKITIVLGAFFPVPPIMGGAVEKVWFALGQEFARRGHEVIQISRTHPTRAQTEEIEGVKHIRIPGFSQPRSTIWLKFLDLIYSRRVRGVLPPADILVTNTFWLPLLTRTRSRGLVYVHVARGPKGQMRWYRKAARLQAVSRPIANAIIAEAPRLREKVRVIPNALPFRVDENADTPNTKTLLYVGRIHPEKGLDLFLRALAFLPNDLLTEWTVKVVGSEQDQHGGGGANFLRDLKQIASRSVPTIEWTGPIFDEKRLSAEYRSAMLFVYPTVAEGGEALPLAPLEAMAHGCAPVVSDLPCFRDYIEDSVTGFVFDHRGSDAAEKLAARLLLALELETSALRQIGAAARAKAAEFAVEPVAQRYLDDFASVLATGFI
jgi:glycosyltransferase involved in cell wall biosynthesis